MESCDQAEPLSVDRDIVTMNSRVAIKPYQGGREFECCLVFPHQADSSRHMISVLAPFGAALLGARVGSTLEVMTPGGRCLYEVRRLLYQPESEGHFYL
jgi:regulator of nucleoside diphosphate kinase